MKRSAEELANIAKRFKKLNPREHVVQRPDMYVGPTRPKRMEGYMPNLKTFQFTREVYNFPPALGKIADEVIVNAYDNINRPSTRKNKRQPTRNIKISYDDTGRVTVRNDGTTIPVAMHETQNMPVPTMVFGHMRTGENYDDKQKRYGGGRNGFGAKLCNIFSSEFSVRCVDSKNGQEFNQTWTDGMQTTAGPRMTKTTNKNDYTEISFIADWKQFKMDKMNRAFAKYITKRALEVAACSPKDVKVYLNDQLLPVNNLGDYVALYTTETVTYVKLSKYWEVAIFPHDGTGDPIVMPSFVNGICTSRGGEHVKHAMQPVFRYLAQAASKKVKGIKVRSNDVKTFCHAFVNALVINPEFESQTKEMLTSDEKDFGSKCDWKDTKLKKFNRSGVLEKVEAWAIAKAGLKLQQKVKSKSRLNIPKLYDANQAGRNQILSAACKILFTEGDSALTTALSGLEIVGRTKWGAFPLKGKLLNVRDASAKQLLENTEVQNVCKILGLVPFQPPNIARMRYGCVVIMADQDHDGSHIKGLVINMFHKFWPNLLKRPGFLKIFKTPVVKVSWRGGSQSFYTEKQYELAKAAKTWPANAKHKYYKGLGTSTPKEAKEYFRDLDTHLYDISYSDIDGDKIDMAFSKKRAADRRSWLTDISEDAGKVDPATITEFVDNELVLFSEADNARSLPSICDGFKESQRKVMFAAFKRNLTKEIRVAQLAGYISEHAAYHHGEASLNGTITGLAQDFPGSNNLPLMVPAGQFGSRLQGGKDAASPRYIHTHLQRYARDIFIKEDDGLLPAQDDDGTPIEPEYYAPVIPMILVNGSTGIGTGYSCCWPQHNPVQLIDFLLGQGQDIQPFFHGYTGTVRYDDNMNVVSTGRWKRKNASTIIIEELPVGIWTQTYSDWLQADRQQKWITKVVKDESTPDRVYFEVQANGLKDEDVVKKFKLSKTLNIILTGFDTKGKLKTWTNYREMLNEWFRWRIDLYEKRRLAIIQACDDQIRLCEEKKSFIMSVINSTLQPRLHTKHELRALLIQNSYLNVDKIIEMPMYAMTRDEMGKLEKLLCSHNQLRNDMTRVGAKELWFRDLRALKNKLV